MKLSDPQSRIVSLLSSWDNNNYCLFSQNTFFFNFLLYPSLHVVQSKACFDYSNWSKFQKRNLYEILGNEKEAPDVYFLSIYQECILGDHDNIKIC